MIDIVNFIVGCICSFILGMAFHSILLHEKKRRGWRFPWNHDGNEKK
jgi:multisubunit Na+/H+ antiporter MnhE subunit